MDLLTLCELPDALKLIDLYQISCVCTLGEDLDFTKEQFSRLADELDPYGFYMISRKYKEDSSIVENFKISSDFKLPETISDLKERIIQRCYSLHIDRSRITERHETVVHRARTSTLWHDDVPLIDVDDIRKDPSLISPEAIADRLNKAKELYERKTSFDHILEKTDSDELSKSKYASDDFHAGIEAGNYFTSRCRPNVFSNVHEDINLDVYDIGLIYDKIKAFELLVYASPGSGKSTFNNKGKFYDTDYLPKWKKMFPHCVITNMHNLIQNAKISIAIVPSKIAFESRCKRLGLTPGPSWYDEMLQNCDNATIKIHSDSYVSDIFFDCGESFREESL